MPDQIKHKNLLDSLEYAAAQPLWQRVPSRTQAGELTFDFIMIIKRLNKCPAVEQKHILDKIYSILRSYSKLILLADLNIKTNVLWISHLPKPHLSIDIASRIHDIYPQARLISHHID